MQSNGQWIPDTPENTYVLAVYQSEEENNNNQVQPNNEAALQQRSSSSSVARSTVTTTELEVSNERKYLVQHWENGDICDVTGQPRKVEVQVSLFLSRARYQTRIGYMNEIILLIRSFDISQPKCSSNARHIMIRFKW